MYQMIFETLFCANYLSIKMQKLVYKQKAANFKMTAYKIYFDNINVDLNLLLKRLVHHPHRKMHWNILLSDLRYYL